MRPSSRPHHSKNIAHRPSTTFDSHTRQSPKRPKQDSQRNFGYHPAQAIVRTDYPQKSATTAGSEPTTAHLLKPVQCQGFETRNQPRMKGFQSGHDGTRTRDLHRVMVASIHLKSDISCLIRPVSKGGFTDLSRLGYKWSRPNQLSSRSLGLSTPRASPTIKIGL